MLEFAKSFIRDESGQDMAEYGLLLAIIGVGVAAAIIALRDPIRAAFERATEELNEANAS